MKAAPIGPGKMGAGCNAVFTGRLPTGPPLRRPGPGIIWPADGRELQGKPERNRNAAENGNLLLPRDSTDTLSPDADATLDPS